MIWNNLEVGDRVTVRGKRSPILRDVTVVELLQRNLDGRGFLGDDGEIYRFFYFDIANVDKTEG